MSLDNEIIYRLKQQIIDSWRDHDGGTPDEAANHYANDAQLIPAFDDSGAVVGQKQIQKWFAFQRQKYSSRLRWGFQHRVMGFRFQLQGQMVKCEQQLLTTGQKRQEDEQIRTFMVPGSSCDVWLLKHSSWEIISREIQIDFAAYGTPESLAPLDFSNHGNSYEGKD